MSSGMHGIARSAVKYKQITAHRYEIRWNIAWDDFWQILEDIHFG